MHKARLSACRKRALQLWRVNRLWCQHDDCGCAAKTADALVTALSVSGTITRVGVMMAGSQAGIAITVPWSRRGACNLVYTFS
jgi:hypothetical protein